MFDNLRDDAAVKEDAAEPVQTSFLAEGTTAIQGLKFLIFKLPKICWSIWLTEPSHEAPAAKEIDTDV